MGNKTERILQWNCRGYRINSAFIDILIDTYHPSIICLQETNIPENLSDQMSKSDSYRGYKNIFQITTMVIPIMSHIMELLYLLTLISIQ